MSYREIKTSKNCLKFKKDKCKVVDLGWNNQRALYRLGSVCLRSNLSERDLGVLVDKLNMNQHCATTSSRQIRSWAAPRGAL